MEYTGYELLWLFLIYSFAGWCLEVSMAAVKRRRLINKGFVNAPFCMIYGFAAVGFAVFLPELRDDPVFLFLGGMILASFLEYWSGRAMEKLFHRKWWDYSDQRFQLDGYVCLKFSIFWGIGAVLMMKFLNPFTLGIVGLIPVSIGKIILWVVYGILTADVFGTTAALLELHHKLGRIEQLGEDLQHLSDSLGNAITRRIQRRMMGAYPNISLPSLLEEYKQEKAMERAGEKVIFGYGCSFYKLASLFLIGAFLGDIVETIFCYVTAGELMSRSSVVYGPFSIVWGLGCVLLTAVLYRYRDSSDRHIFLAGTVLGGAYEYFCSVFTELVFGTVFWDYSELPFNLGGRINLLYCFFWGIAAVVWLKLFYPAFSRWIERIPVRTGKIGCNLVILFMIFNMGISALALGRYTQRQMTSAVETASPAVNAGGTETFKQLEGQVEQELDDELDSDGLGRFLDEHFPDARIERIYPNLKIVD